MKILILLQDSRPKFVILEAELLEENDQKQQIKIEVKKEPIEVKKEPT